MDAQIYQLEEQRSRRAASMVFPAPVDLIAATRSVTEFMVWYAGAMLTIHAALVRSAVSAVQHEFGRH